MAVGYVYITVVIIGRKTPFLTENGNSWDFTALMLFINPFIFFTSTLNNWRHKHSKMCAIIGQLPVPCEYQDHEVYLYNHGIWTTCFFLGL